MVLTLISNHCFKLTISVGMPNYCFTLHQYIWHCGTNANSCVGVRGSIALHLWECEGNLLYTYYLWECVTFALHLLSVECVGTTCLHLLYYQLWECGIILLYSYYLWECRTIVLHLFSCSFCSKLPCQSSNKSVNYSTSNFVFIYMHASLGRFSAINFYLLYLVVDANLLWRVFM